MTVNLQAWQAVKAAFFKNPFVFEVSAAADQKQNKLEEDNELLETPFQLISSTYFYYSSPDLNTCQVSKDDNNSNAASTKKFPLLY